MKVIKNEQGQGTVEYILILVIVVAIAIGGLYQFNTAFARFSDNYFGEYLACLLETGELPNLGAEAGTSCDASFEEFDINSGRKPLEIVQGAGGSASQVDRNNGTQGRSSSAGDGEGGAATRNVGASKSRSTNNRFGSDQGGGRKDSQLGARKIKGGSGGDGDEENLKAQSGLKSQEFEGVSAGKREKIATGLNNNGSEDKEDKSKVKKGLLANNTDSEGRQRKIKVKKKIRKVAVKEESSFTIGNFLKYLLIAGIIIAIVIFIGGQALQISKEWD